MFWQELDHVRNEVTKLATAASLKESALQRKDAQVLDTVVLDTVASHAAHADCCPNYVESSSHSPLDLQVGALQEDKRGLEQVADTVQGAA